MVPRIPLFPPPVSDDEWPANPTNQLELLVNIRWYSLAKRHLCRIHSCRHPCLQAQESHCLTPLTALCPICSPQIRTRAIRDLFHKCHEIFQKCTGISFDFRYRKCEPMDLLIMVLMRDSVFFIRHQIEHFQFCSHARQNYETESQ